VRVLDHNGGGKEAPHAVKDREVAPRGVHLQQPDVGRYGPLGNQRVERPTRHGDLPDDPSARSLPGRDERRRGLAPRPRLVLDEVEGDLLVARPDSHVGEAHGRRLGEGLPQRRRALRERLEGVHRVGAGLQEGVDGPAACRPNIDGDRVPEAADDRGQE
jgi:hypothetical protein